MRRPAKGRFAGPGRLVERKGPVRPRDAMGTSCWAASPWQRSVPANARVPGAQWGRVARASVVTVRCGRTTNEVPGRRIARVAGGCRVTGDAGSRRGGGAWGGRSVEGGGFSRVLGADPHRPLVEGKEGELGDWCIPLPLRQLPHACPAASPAPIPLVGGSTRLP